MTPWILGLIAVLAFLGYATDTLRHCATPGCVALPWQVRRPLGEKRWRWYCRSHAHAITASNARIGPTLDAFRAKKAALLGGSVRAREHTLKRGL